MPKLLFSVDPTETFSGIQIQIFHILDKGMLGITILLEIILIAEVNSCTGKLKCCFKIMNAEYKSYSKMNHFYNVMVLSVCLILGIVIQPLPF